jgi:5-methylcytosine-specific restriction endonuclease McrA
VPKVVKVRYEKPPYDRVSFSRRKLYKRDHYACQYCGCRPGSEELTVDHIVPQSKGGPTSWENCCLACVECNSHKADRTPAQAGMKFHFKGYTPVKPKWSLFRDEPTFYQKHYKEWADFVSDMYWDVELV